MDSNRALFEDDQHGVTTRSLEKKCDSLLARCVADIESSENSQNPFLSAGSILKSILLQAAERRLPASSQEGSCPEGGYAGLALAHLCRALELQNGRPFSSSLFRGVTGIGWAVQTFNNSVDLPWRNGLLSDLDEELTEGLDQSKDHCLDIVNGLAGIAVYALSRGNSCNSARNLWELVDSKTCSSLSKWTQGNRGSDLSEFYQNLGCAHGVPGLLNVAAVACSIGIGSKSLSAVTVEALDALWNERSARGGYFPSTRGESRPARLAWCYGALGLTAVYKNSIRLSNDSKSRFHKLCELSIDQYWQNGHGICDASLCHGFAGVALATSLFSKELAVDPSLSSALHDVSYHAGRAALDQEVDRDGTSTFYFSAMGAMRPSIGLLEGKLGIALSLVAMFERDKPAWVNLLGY